MDFEGLTAASRTPPLSSRSIWHEPAGPGAPRAACASASARLASRVAVPPRRHRAALQPPDAAAPRQLLANKASIPPLVISTRISSVPTRMANRPALRRGRPSSWAATETPRAVPTRIRASPGPVQSDGASGSPKQPTVRCVDRACSRSEEPGFRVSLVTGPGRAQTANGKPCPRS